MVPVSLVFVSPHWFMASMLSDGDEAVKTCVGVGMVAMAIGVLKFFQR